MAQCGPYMFKYSRYHHDCYLLCELFSSRYGCLDFLHYFWTNSFKVPETPSWLMSKNRPDDARKALQWLRGWVSPKAVEKEFQELQRYNETCNSCSECEKLKVKCSHPPPSTLKKLKDLKRTRNMKPFLLVLLIFTFTQFTGLPPMRPYLVLILKGKGINLVIWGVLVKNTWGYTHLYI